jgi:vitamin B12 transporter
MYKTKFLFALFSIFLFSFFSFAQNTIIQKTDSSGFYKLNDVVITATKTPANRLELANSISVNDSIQISNSNSNNVFDLIKNETGISFTRQGGNGTLSTLYIRGANSSHTLVLIDGVEMNLTNDPSGVYDFSALPIDNIERIEVLRGPQSTLYGSDALAGVINIITKNGSGSPKLSLLTEGGTYNSYKILAGTDGAYKDFNYSLTLSKTGSDGFSAASEKYGNKENDGYTFQNLSALLGYKINEIFDVKLFNRYTKSKSDYDQFGGEFGDDPTYIFDQEEISWRGEGNINLLDGFWKQKIGLSYIRNVRKYSYDTSSASIYASNSFYDGRKYKLDWQNDFIISNSNLLTAGAEFEFDEAESEYYAYTYLSIPDIASVIPMSSSRTIGVYIQDQVNIDKSFFATGGVRLDNHDKFGSKFTYRIAPAYILWQTNTKFKVTIGTGFKAPSLYYLYDPSYGNENLNPEESFGWDAGIEQFFFNQNFSFGVTYFYNKFTDMFGFDYVTFKTINIKKAATKGWEFTVEAKPFDGLNLKANYTYTDARDLSPNSADYDKKLLRRPENKAGIYVSYSFIPKANINFDFIWVGKRDDINFSLFERTQLEDYFLINIAAHYDVFDFLRLNARIENLLDTDYEEVYGYGTTGLSFYGGIKFTLN